MQTEAKIDTERNHYYLIDPDQYASNASLSLYDIAKRCMALRKDKKKLIYLAALPRQFINLQLIQDFAAAGLTPRAPKGKGSRLLFHVSLPKGMSPKDDGIEAHLKLEQIIFPSLNTCIPVTRTFASLSKRSHQSAVQRLIGHIAYQEVTPEKVNYSWFQDSAKIQQAYIRLILRHLGSNPDTPLDKHYLSVLLKPVFSRYGHRGLGAFIINWAIQEDKHQLLRLIADECRYDFNTLTGLGSVLLQAIDAGKTQTLKALLDKGLQPFKALSYERSGYPRLISHPLGQRVVLKGYTQLEAKQATTEAKNLGLELLEVLLKSPDFISHGLATRPSFRNAFPKREQQFIHHAALQCHNLVAVEKLLEIVYAHPKAAADFSLSYFESLCFKKFHDFSMPEKLHAITIMARLASYTLYPNTAGEFYHETYRTGLLKTLLTCLQQPTVDIKYCDYLLGKYCQLHTNTLYSKHYPRSYMSKIELKVLLDVLEALKQLFHKQPGYEYTPLRHHAGRLQDVILGAVAHQVEAQYRKVFTYYDSSKRCHTHDAKRVAAVCSGVKRDLTARIAKTLQLRQATSLGTNPYPFDSTQLMRAYSLDTPLGVLDAMHQDLTQHKGQFFEHLAVLLYDYSNIAGPHIVCNNALHARALAFTPELVNKLIEVAQACLKDPKDARLDWLRFKILDPFVQQVLAYKPNTQLSQLHKAMNDRATIHKLELKPDPEFSEKIKQDLDSYIAEILSKNTSSRSERLNAEPTVETSASRPRMSLA